jgi:hypothetical protein
MRFAGWLLLLLPGLILLSLPRVGVRSGMVCDERGPVAQASVRVQTRSHNTFSDDNGRFALETDRTARRITAWKAGYFIAGVPAWRSPLQLRLRRLPTEDHADYDWVDPEPAPAEEGRCGNCHAQIGQEWAASGHARSATNRRFRNLYDGSDWHGRPGKGWSLMDEHPNGTGVCAACHAPTLRDDDPALFDLRQVQGVAARGVHCDYCHKVTGLDEGEIGLTHGRFLLKLLRPAEGQLFFGPLDDVDRGEETYSPFYRDSRFCAPCHEGVVFGVPVYTTYSEWLRSPARRAGQSCQSCHMKPTGQMSNFAPGRGGVERDPWTLGNHHFFDGSHADMLRRCLDVQIHGVGTRVEVRLVTRDVGHAVPTGFIDKHLLLVVEGQDGAGRPVTLRTGSRLPSAAGDLAGRGGRLYARLLRDEHGQSPVPFWRAVPESQDTRLQPGVPDVQAFAFEPGLSRVRVRVLYRRFWHDQSRLKGWPSDELVVVDRQMDMHRLPKETLSRPARTSTP